MKIILFTLLTCKECREHIKEIRKICSDHNISDFRIFNLDDEDHYRFFLNAMKSFNITMVPSLVLTKDQQTLVISGMNKESVNNLKNKINEYRIGF